MNPSKLAENLLKKIEQEKITPRSKLYFIAQNISFWSLFALAILVGSVSFAIILYAGLNTDFEVSDFVEKNELLSHWLTLLPLVWVLLIGVAVGIGIVGLKHTKSGYRIALLTLVGSNVLGSLVLGSGLYAAGGAEMIEETLEQNFDLYESTREKHQKFWGNPAENGRLAGRVLAVDETLKIMTIEGPYGEQWQVPYGENRLIESAPQVGEMIKLKGRLDGKKRFKPDRLRPAKKQEMMQQRIERHLDKHPELRQKIETKLTPETQAQLEILRTKGALPSGELRQKIRQEVKQNSTEVQRTEFRSDVKKTLKASGELEERWPALRPPQPLPENNLRP